MKVKLKEEYIITRDCGAGNEIFGQNEPKRTTITTTTKILLKKSEMKYSNVVSMFRLQFNDFQLPF